MKASMMIEEIETYVYTLLWSIDKAGMMGLLGEANKKE